MICASHRCYLDDQIKKNVLGGACGTYRDLRGTYRALVGDRREINYLENLSVDGREILKYIFKKWDRVE